MVFLLIATNVSYYPTVDNPTNRNREIAAFILFVGGAPSVIGKLGVSIPDPLPFFIRLKSPLGG
jgi:hypothetical protein